MLCSTACALYMLAPVLSCPLCRCCNLRSLQMSSEHCQRHAQVLQLAWQLISTATAAAVVTLIQPAPHAGFQPAVILAVLVAAAGRTTWPQLARHSATCSISCSAALQRWSCKDAVTAAAAAAAVFSSAGYNPQERPGPEHATCTVLGSALDTVVLLKDSRYYCSPVRAAGAASAAGTAAHQRVSLASTAGVSSVR
jgi:hypothetical protein